jgi:hypothetical protein
LPDAAAVVLESVVDAMGRRMPTVKMPSSFVEVSGCGVNLRWPSRQTSDFDHYSRPMILGAALRNNRGAFVVKALPDDAIGVLAVAGHQIGSIAFDQAMRRLSAFEPTEKHDDHSRFRIASSIERSKRGISFAVHLGLQIY